MASLLSPPNFDQICVNHGIRLHHKCHVALIATAPITKNCNSTKQTRSKWFQH